MEQLKIQERRGVNYSLLELSGVLDSYNFTEFQQKAYALIKDNNLVIDLSNLASIDSSGISTIFGSITLGQEFGRTLYIMNPSPEARKALSSTGFMDTFNIIFSVTEVI